DGQGSQAWSFVEIIQSSIGIANNIGLFRCVFEQVPGVQKLPQLHRLVLSIPFHIGASAHQLACPCIHDVKYSPGREFSWYLEKQDVASQIRARNVVVYRIDRHGAAAFLSAT
ncbi:MAG: hypothetical protein NTZ28_13080, partial [Nitrospirae bacterium]|nr:hypothetical protein [Nitrospirota bacterium]